MAIGWILTATAITGNFLVLFLIVITKRLQTTANYFVLSLAVADFLFAVFFFPFAYFCDTMFACDDRLRGILSWQFAIISISNLCGMATDRYVAIVRPFKYVKFMISRTFLFVIVSAWVLPPFLYLPTNLYIHFAGASKSTQLLFQVIYGILFEIIPCLFLLCVTGRILVISRRHWRQTAAFNTQLPYNQPRLRESKAQFSVIIVVVGILIIFHVMDVAGSIFFYFDVCELTVEFHYVRKLMLIANSAANPFPYAFIKRDIKREFVRIFRSSVQNIKKKFSRRLFAFSVFNRRNVLMLLGPVN